MKEMMTYDLNYESHNLENLNENKNIMIRFLTSTCPPPGTVKTTGQTVSCTMVPSGGTYDPSIGYTIEYWKGPTGNHAAGAIWIIVTGATRNVAITQNYSVRSTDSGSTDFWCIVKDNCPIGPLQCGSADFCVLILNPVCTWITNNGGIHPMPIANISTLIAGYLGYQNLGFTVTVSYISGAISYYLGYISSGNSLTGCSLI